MLHNLKSLAVIACLASAAVASAAQPNQILLYCDVESDKPRTLTSEEDGSQFEAILSYRGYYRIDVEAETLETQWGGVGDFHSKCHQDGACTLLTSGSFIRFENFGRRYEGKTIDETYRFERNTGFLSIKTEIRGRGEPTIEYASGHCRPVESINANLF